VNYDIQSPDECAIWERLSNRDEKSCVCYGQLLPPMVQGAQQILFSLLQTKRGDPQAATIQCQEAVEDGVMDKRKGLDNESL
jgi:hypothetical protein